MQTLTCKIDGMHCDGCASRITRLLERVPGVREVVVSFPQGRAEIQFDPEDIGEDRLTGIIEKAGFSIAVGDIN